MMGSVHILFLVHVKRRLLCSEINKKVWKLGTQNFPIKVKFNENIPTFRDDLDNGMKSSLLTPVTKA